MILRSIVMYFVVLWAAPSVLNAQYDSIFFDGMRRYFLLHLPTDYSPEIARPVVMALHGGFGSGSGTEMQSGLSQKADEEGFIAVYPEGVKGPFGIRTWNGGACCGFATNNKIDDVGFLNTLLDTLIDRYAIDRDRIYVTGMSNGGFMAYRMACESSGRIAAIAPVASTMNTDCNEPNPVPVIHFHSYLDKNIPQEGGIGGGVSKHYNPPLDSVLHVWAGFNGCVPQEDTIRDEMDYDHLKWSDCDCGADVELYITHDGGHSWPGGMRLSMILDPPSEVISATDLMWSFFVSHSLCDRPTLAKTIGEDRLSVRPNPTRDLFYLSKPIQELIYMYDWHGRIVRTIYPPRQIIDISNWPVGVYWLKTSGEPAIKIVKTNY